MSEEGTVTRLLRHPHMFVQHTGDQCTYTWDSLPTIVEIDSRTVKSKDENREYKGCIKVKLLLTNFAGDFLSQRLDDKRIHMFFGQDADIE